nr:phosphoribosyltransferase family protein [Chitinimonas koreensis]
MRRLPRRAALADHLALPGLRAADAAGRTLRRLPAIAAGLCRHRRGLGLPLAARPADPAFKYGHDLALAHPLADGLARAAATAERPELLVAMPLHPARLRERGFNQSQLLAQRLATALGLPLDRHAVRRIKDTPPQASLPWDERRRSIRGAFAVADGLAGRHVALVDDVMTTGASLDELARSLLAAGAVRVDCWVAARALRD